MINHEHCNKFEDKLTCHPLLQKKQELEDKMTNAGTELRKATDALERHQP